ncbi:hypothetical protein C2G38_1553810 [Gigaspora rosea]|uniref:Uncharacterized protein n=1 Tax=Gigaspora rosea TaxID=44941 RepID=A0A397V2L7_9GLOM|nr:hypothetical protein C2G38_1553810 [Gigaspora rosea]
MHESRRPFISRSLPGEHTAPKSLPASLPTTPVTFQIPTSSLTVPAAQQATGIEGKLVKPRNRRSLSTSSSQSLLKKSLSKPRALSNLYPSNLLSTIEGDANNRSSFEDFDFSTPGILPTGTNSGSNSSSSSSNSPYLTSFPFYQRERHHSLFVLSQPQQQQQQRPSTLLQQQNLQNLLHVPSTQSSTAVSSTSSQQKLSHQPIQRRQSGASSQLKRLLSLKSESYPLNTPSLYSDSETDSLETDSDAYITNDEHFLSSSIKRKPSFQKSRFFPDLSIDAEQNRLSNLHIIDDGSPEFTFPKVKRKLLKDLEEAKSRADKRIMVILDNWYKSHQYQELLSEFLYDGWSDDDDIQPSPINIQKKSSQRTLNKEMASPIISDTDDEASHKDKLLPEVKSMKKDILLKDKITHKMESMSLYGNTKPKNILRKSKNFKRRLVHSNSWPSSILTSSHTLLLTRIDRIARRILKTAVHDLLHFNVAVEIMKELQELMESQRKMAVGNADAEDLLTKLIYVFADVTRAVEAVNYPLAESHHNDFSGDSGINDILTTGSEWSSSPLPSPLLPMTPSSYSPPRILQERRKSSLEIDGNNKSNTLLSPPLAFSSPLARHVTMPQLPSTPKITLEQRRASANEAIFESPIMYIPPSRPSMDDSLLTWNNLTKKQVDQMLHEEMNREIDFSIRLKKQQEDVDQDSRKKTKKSKTMMNFFKSIKNAFNSPTSSTSVSPIGSPTRSIIQPSPIRNVHLPRPPPVESLRTLSFDSQSHTSHGRSNSMMSSKSDVGGLSVTIPQNFPIPHDYILCRICEEMIPSYEIVAHSETCAITTEYAIKLQECDGRLRRLIGDVTKRKAEIMYTLSRLLYH